ncbi:hypothetical protein LE191_12670 [Janthinobacterium sp. HSC-3S05]|uniref:hypothetical protein n=1 Tax=Janthinobacterium lividum TaxID=29581 RepID=UPI001CD8DD56|nr:hypothetical protein [Janthinobacterium lividum]MCA1860956.1 hypothetical protein [Janthinobacterium lividum]
MSKRTAIKANNFVISDIFGAPNRKFALRIPDDFSFFNSLKLRDTDSFGSVSVAIVDSVFWRSNGEVCTSVGDGANVIYASTTNEDQLPNGVSVDRIDRWLVVTSRELFSPTSTFKSALSSRGCIENLDSLDDFFMLFRANSLISFDENLRDQAKEDLEAQPTYEGYEDTPLSDVFPYYEKFSIFRLDATSALNGKSIFWLSYLVASGLSGTRSHFTADAYSNIDNIYNDGMWHFPVDNARTAVVASHFKHCYLELYRCVEWLYSLPRARAVKRHLGLTIKATDLARTLRDELGWRRSELDSLRLLLLDVRIDNIPNSLISGCLLCDVPEMPSLVNSALPDTDEGRGKLELLLVKWRADLAGMLSTRLYAIRNQFVHQLDRMDMQDVPIAAQSHLITLMSYLCLVLYREYADDF